MISIACSNFVHNIYMKYLFRSSHKLDKYNILQIQYIVLHKIIGHTQFYNMVSRAMPAKG